MTAALDQAIAEMEARAERATPGPWRRQTDAIVSVGAETKLDLVFDSSTCPYPPKTVDLEFIAHARADLPALCRALRKMKEQRDGYRKNYWAVEPRHGDRDGIAEDNDAEILRALKGEAT